MNGKRFEVVGDSEVFVMDIRQVVSSPSCLDLLFFLVSSRLYSEVSIISSCEGDNDVHYS
jgi:hypothetical protein